MTYPEPGNRDLSQIECPNCGKPVPFEVLVCPNCGLHLYLDDLIEEEETPEPAPPTPRPERQIISILLTGFLFAALVTLLIEMVASHLWTTETLSTVGKLVLFIAGPLGALLGGYAAAANQSRRSFDLQRVLGLGLGVSLLNLAPVLLSESYWYNLAIMPLRPLAIASILVMLLIGPLGSWIWLRTTRATVDLPEIPSPDELHSYYKLLAYVRHDMDIAEQLIAYERKRSPNASRKKLIENAIYHLKQDQH